MEDDWATTRFVAFAGLSDAELAHLGSLAGPEQRLAKGAVLRREGEPAPQMYLLASGWTASSITVAGGRRQTIKVHLPGDLLGLPSLALAEAADTITALTDVRLLGFPLAAIGDVFERHPRLAAMLFLISQQERVALMDRLASFGRTDAIGRVASVILQLCARVRAGDPSPRTSFRIPLTQADLADLTGLTKIHINRTIARLREEGVVDWRRQSLDILDMARLEQLGGLPPRTLVRDLSWLPAPR